MEKKTIGGLIAALRRANGMTQKELAEKLNVSDKTVSRWERDDGLPELSLVPVIAEVFGITCDELLCGERRSPEQRESEAGSRTANPEKTEKQRMRLLKNSEAQYKMRSGIAAGISAAGFLAALIVNFGLLKAVLAFGAAALFSLAAVMVQSTALSRAFLAVDDAELPDEMLHAYHRRIVKTAERSFTLTAVLLAAVLPMLLVIGSGVATSAGLGADAFLLYGGILAALVLAAAFFICRRCNDACMKKGVWTLEESEAQRYQKNHRLQNLTAGVLTAVLCVTGMLHGLLSQTQMYRTGLVFNDYESFVEYMEREEKAPARGLLPNGTADFPVEIEPKTEIWYDENGNEITEEQARTRTLEDQDGRVVCTYIDRNENCTGISYSPKKGTVLPITVYTRQDSERAREQAQQASVLFIPAYFIEIAAAAFFYWKKRAV